MVERLVIGMSGASGAPLTVVLLKQLKKYQGRIETHLVYTRGAEMTLSAETDLNIAQLRELADVVHDCDDIGASIASGSYRTMGMVIVPCSMKTLAGIVSGYSENLLLRAADVTLKERRKLVVVPRECPFGTIHLRNLYDLSTYGAVVIPPVLSYYQGPQSIDDCTNHIVGKIMDQFGLEADGYKRWE
ncbi:MAG: UbiX family flavin prenyltransferase [Lachnospiraceae bacterium]|nr:UbiX family flavin prenyltransferase [Lachnospiraceae bacterium]